MTTMASDRHEGRAFSYDVAELGYNYRSDEIRSAIGIIQLEKLPENNYRREGLTRIYKKRLLDIPQLEVPFDTINGTSSFHIFPILLGSDFSRSEFMSFMKSKGVQTSIHYPSTHLFKFYRHNYGYNNGFLPVTEEVSQREVTLPLYPSMKDEDVHCVCDVISEYIKERKIRK
tara:strand:- start:653 stop:1171 length:519 start_codon:yes stop_codon:yes gene_type:complete